MAGISMEKETVTVYRQGDLRLLKSEKAYCMTIKDQLFQISDYPYEPYLRISGGDGTDVVIHNAFTADELYRAAETDGSIGLITGNVYDMHGICALLTKAVSLQKGSFDTGYLEGLCFMDILAQCGAFSAETAADLSSCGMKNPKMMNPFVHAKKVCRKDGMEFWLVQECR